MAEIIKSALTGKEYNLATTIRLINIQQSCFYITNGVMPVDIYVSKDFNTNKPILVFLFNREQTKPLYAEWLANRPSKEES